MNLHPDPQFELVQVSRGAWSVRSLVDQETFHPVVGPVAEAEALYVQQLDLKSRVSSHPGEFVLWDVGLGAAANVLTVLNVLRDTTARIRIESFDHTLAPLSFALGERSRLSYFDGFEQAVGELLGGREVRWRHGRADVIWRAHVMDFPGWLASASAAAMTPPDAVMWDAYSPARNPAMWTLPVFQRMRALSPAGHPCALATYSRSTLLRVTLLVAGYWVGAGLATGEKEETTIAATDPALVPALLPPSWLERVRRSRSAEPLREPIYGQGPLQQRTLDVLLKHPQFQRPS